MKTNISVELNDQQRVHLANVFHGKPTKKMISRKEVTNLVTLMINDLLNENAQSVSNVTERIAKEGFIYRFNDIEVSEEQFEAGIQAWKEI